MSKINRLAILPTVVIGAVIAIPFLAGNDPIRIALPHSGSEQAAAAIGAQPSTGPTGQPTAADYPVRQVSSPWQSGMPQWGVQIYWEDQPSQPDSTVWAKAQRLVDYIVGLHANSLEVSFPFYTPGISASSVGAHWQTPVPRRLSILLEEAHSAGLRTSLRPILDEKSLNPPKGWRGNITPASLDDWFGSYEKFLTPYAELAEQQHVSTIVIGTELNSLEGDPRWQHLVDSLGGVFHGELAYSANYDNYARKMIQVPVSHLGVDAYPAIDVPDTASVSDLVAGWNQWLDHKSTGKLPRVVLSEVGIGAEQGAYRAPGDFYAQRPVDPQVQAHWYEAACTIAHQRNMAGLYWWSINFDEDPGKAPSATDSRLDFAGRPLTEAAIRSCFSTTYTVPTSAATG